MKRMVLIALGLLLFAGSGFAQTYPGLPDTAYVGLFADLARTVRQVNYTATPPAFTPFTMYIWWLPNNEGLQACEFKISAPSNVLMATVTKNPLVIIELGQLATGMSCSFAEGACVTDWVYSHSVMCFLKDNTLTQIEVVEHPGILPFPAYQVASCEAGYPIYPVKRFTHLYMNWDGGIAVDHKSWGAIKSLF